MAMGISLVARVVPHFFGKYQWSVRLHRQLVGFSIRPTTKDLAARKYCVCFLLSLSLVTMHAFGLRLT